MGAPQAAGSRTWGESAILDQYGPARRDPGLGRVMMAHICKAAAPGERSAWLG